MAYSDKTLRRDMHQEPVDKLFTGDRYLFPPPLDFIFFKNKCNSRIRNAFDAVIADGNQMCVFAKVLDDRLRAMEGFLAVRAIFVLSIINVLWKTMEKYGISKGYYSIGSYIEEVFV